MWRRRYFHGINAMILMPQIFDVTANENARYKGNELEFHITNFPFLSSNIPSSLAYGVFISQRIRYARACPIMNVLFLGRATFQ